MQNLTLSVFTICASAFATLGSSPSLAADYIHQGVDLRPSVSIKHVGSEDSEGAKNFISGVSKRGIDFLSNEKLSKAQRKQEFRQLLKSSFDIKTIGRFSLGRYWKVATPAQQKEYLGLFEEMIIDVYSQRFDEYQGQSVNVVDSKEEGNGDFFVFTEIVPENGPKFKVTWRVRFRDGQYKIVDVIVEGVSMALTQRSDFSSVIQRGGGNVSVLIDHLKK